MKGILDFFKYMPIHSKAGTYVVLFMALTKIPYFETNYPILGFISILLTCFWLLLAFPIIVSDFYKSVIKLTITRRRK